MKKLSPIQVGKIGERRIVWYLRLRGYRIREKNMRNGYSEIDIIAEKRKLIVFVEVKTRTSGTLFPPRAAVNTEKRKKIITASRAYMKYKNIKKQVRYDIAEVYLIKDKYRVESINYIKDAFCDWRGYATF